MADLSVKTIDQLTVGTLLRVYFPSSANSALKSFVPSHQGLFRIQDGGEKTTLNHTDWRKIVGVNRRSFTAYVIANDTVNQRLLLEFEEAGTTDTVHNRYQIDVPYKAFMRLSRLVSNARVMTVEQETRYRRQHRRTPIYKQCWSPFDQFVGVQIIAYARSGDMTISFTYQIPSTGTSWVIPLPSGAVADENYNVVASFNTIVGVPSHMSIPDVQKTSTSFVLNSSGTLTSGTTIDFFVKER